MCDEHQRFSVRSGTANIHIVGGATQIALPTSHRSEASPALMDLDVSSLKDALRSSLRHRIGHRDTKLIGPAVAGVIFHRDGEGTRGQEGLGGTLMPVPKQQTEIRQRVKKAR